MGEREKGHEWSREQFEKWWSSTNNQNWFSNKPITLEHLKETAMYAYRAAHLASLEAQPRTYKCVKCCDTGTFAGLPCQLCSAGHPSAGQSDASLEQECREFIDSACSSPDRVDIGKCYMLTSHREIMAPLLAQFIRTRLAESRAAMREECARVIDDSIGCYDDDEGAQRIALRLAQAAIRALPADLSALDARDARVRLEARLDEYDFIEQMAEPISHHGWWHRRKAELKEQLAQRSAEKGKGE